MSGHVFHPGPDEWHGQTVVVFTSGARTVIGRWDAVQEGTLLMRDAAVHDTQASDELREDWVVERGERPRYHLNDTGACVESGWVYWNENTLLVLDDPAWAIADEERAAVIAAFLSLVRPAATP